MQPNNQLQPQTYNYENPTEHHSHKKLVIGVVVSILLIAAFSGVAYVAWDYHEAEVQSRDTRIAQLNQALEETPGIQVVPEGFSEYRNEDIGFSFAYPSEWGSVIVLDSDSASIEDDYFYATFSSLPSGDGPRGGGNIIAFGAPNRNASTPSRGRIHTDFPGFSRSGTDYVHVRSIFSDNETANINFVSRGETRVIQGWNTVGITVEESNSEFYGYSYIEGRFNMLSGSYNGINFVTSDTSYRSDFMQMLETFRTL